MTEQEQALIHLAWYRDGAERHLIFGWVEILPACFPPMRGHPRRDFRFRRNGPCLHLARFPMSAADARDWYNNVKNGMLCLPRHPDMASPGDGAQVSTSKLRPEPEDDGVSHVLRLAFLPTMHSTVIACGLLGEIPPHVAEEIGRTDANDWLMEHLFFDLSVYQEYLGGVFLVRQQPVVRDAACLRAIEGDHEVALVRIRRWPGTNLSGHRLLAVEQRTLGYSTPQEQPAEDQLLRVVHGKK